jgi:hypothetical protein
MEDSRLNLVRVGIKRLPAVDLVARGRMHVEKMQGNPVFPDPTPGLAEVTAACDLLETRDMVYRFNRGRGDLLLMRSAYANLYHQIRCLAAYVQAVSHSDPRLMVQAGFFPRMKRQPPQPMPAPQWVRSIRTMKTGQVHLLWAGVKGRRSYQVWMNASSDGAESGWQRCAVTSKNQITLDGLPSREGFSFPVEAIGAYGVGPASPVCRVMAA